MTSPPIIRGLLARPRFLTSVALFLGAITLLPVKELSTRFLVAWDAASATFILLAWTMAARSENADIQRRADEEDAGAFLVLILSVVAALVSLAGIGAELHGMKDAPDGMKALRLTLAGLTILLSWFLVHTIFALHYAHDYYAGDDDRRGLTFPGDDQPDYWDFLYFSFTIGAAAQTSDVEVTAPRMRRLVLAQTILSFLFNTTILALAINVGAGML